VTSIRGWAESQGHKFPADSWGKVKMFLQCFAVGIVVGLVAFELPASAVRFWSKVAHVCVIATLVASVGSGVSYVVQIRRLIANSAQ
jgi:phosphatidylglycerophosphate synthase